MLGVWTSGATRGLDSQRLGFGLAAQGGVSGAVFWREAKNETFYPNFSVRFEPNLKSHLSAG